jgi:polyhydroxyalkanoate synthesis regulator phasin
MKYTGKYSMHENISNNPSKPFVDDLLKDLKKLDEYYSEKQSKSIKKEMIDIILKSI